MPESFSIYPQNRFSKTTSVGSAALAVAYPVTQPSQTAPVGGLITSSGGKDLILQPYATSTTFTGLGMRVVSYSRYLSAANLVWYLPQVLASFTLTRSTATNPVFSIDALTDVVPMSLIALEAGLLVNVLPKTYIGAAAGVEMASVSVDTMGADIIQLQFKSSGDQIMGAFYRYA